MKKPVISTISLFLVLITFGSFFVVFAMILLEISYGIAPPIGFATAVFVLALSYGAVWQISVSIRRKLPKNELPKRILLIKFLRAAGKTQ
ncbi:MAG: hypothetical protein LC778_09610 [Acidobacteria bacterium]|nr:hypothetical protein [Acidobacteriota bacterium]